MFLGLKSVEVGLAGGLFSSAPSVKIVPLVCLAHQENTHIHAHYSHTDSLAYRVYAAAACLYMLVIIYKSEGSFYGL